MRLRSENLVYREGCGKWTQLYATKMCEIYVVIFLVFWCETGSDFDMLRKPGACGFMQTGTSFCNLLRH